MNWFISVISGLSYGGLLFIIASGLTLTIGLMRRINLAHGALFLVGGYVAFGVATTTDNYWLGLVLGVLLAGVLGSLVEWGLLQRIANNVIAQIVLTVGVGFVLQDQLRSLFGANPLLPPTPPNLGGQFEVAGQSIPLFQVITLLVAITLAILLMVLLKKTSVGSKVRAAVDDLDMARSVGIKVRYIYVAVFFIGSALAGFAGVWGGAYMSLEPEMGWNMLLLGLVVVVIGGLNSVFGGLLAGLTVGLIQQFGQSYFPQWASFIVYSLVVIVLLFRPTGMLGKEVSAS